MAPDPQLAFLAGDSSLARQIREADWSRSPLGPPQQWPQSLRSVVNVLLGSAFPMFVAWGPELGMLYNDAYAEILGRKHPASLGAPFEQVWADIHKDIMPFVRRALGGEAFFVEDLPLRMHRRGFDEDTWFTFSYSPVRDESGQIAGFFCACSETTKAVLAQRQLREREEWLTSLFDRAPGFAAVLRGPDHVFDMVNEAYRQITGHRPLIGKKLADALPEVVEQGFGALLDEVFSTGEPYIGRSVPVTVAQGPGRAAYEAYIDFMYQPLRDAAGRVEAIFVQGHDVTELHRAQEVLRSADRQKDQFLATLAHELRNPLAPIRTAAHLLEHPSADEAARQRSVAIIGRQVRHMSRLLDDLIDIARITQQRLVLRKEDVRVGDVVDAAMEAARPMADAKRHTVTADVDSPATRVYMDPVRITQVLSNLLNNAVKYTDPGGRIVLTVRADAKHVRFAVEDNGIGMDPEALASLFVMFAQREEALARAEGGLGIGLALAKGLVELHGGTLRATSGGPGQGSRFEAVLPVRPMQEAEEVAPIAVRAAGPSKVVLLADDNLDAAEVMAQWLRLSGYEVSTAPDGAAAAKLAMDIKPDVLVLDIGMPGLNGYEVARRVRAEPWGRNALLIAATGWGQLSDREKAAHAGFDAHLTKPFAPDDLVAAIRQPRT
jgi:PAS domain S-box-containing protein